MKEKIEEIRNKIIKLIDEDDSSDKDFKSFRFRNIDVNPVRKQKVLFDLFPCGAPNQFDLSVLERMIAESKLEASKYNKPELVVAGFLHSKSIILYYWETEEEVLERLTFNYNGLIEKMIEKKEKEYKKYMELKLKYEK